MEEWFEAMGNYYMAFPGAPALAVDMALNGLPTQAGYAGYGLAASMIGTEAEIELYPPEEPSFEGLG
ncbi:hypothetical protein [Streptomyces halobius]|uniref:Uncharacterized protein n=1 Tax=Streptomyces halobius TaxID=2879846 RepID=A0ABY4M1K6_9ACTN|nr:hypothetical protein [Streptomyces halobius]UQA91640.1 hypothetical protein K9S39_06995 [Streptomyces halobius]